MRVFGGLGIFWYGFMRGIFDEGPEYVRIAWALFSTASMYSLCLVNLDSVTLHWP